jgi:hypothetical protein
MYIHNRKVGGFMQSELDRYRHRFNQLLGALPCAYILGEVIVNGNGEPQDYAVKDINHAFSNLTGLAKESIVGKRVSGLFSMSSVKDDTAIFSNVAVTGEPIEREFYSPYFDLYFRLFCFSPDKGSFIALLSDLSQKKQFQRHLEFMKTYANTTADEFYVLDSAGRFVVGNKTLADKLGTSQDRIPGMHISALNSIVEGEWWNTLWGSLLERGSLQFETDHKGHDSVVYPVELSIDLMEHDGRQLAAVVAKNISRKHSLSKAIRQDRRFVEQAASMAGYLIWMINSSGVFRPLIGGESGFVPGPVDDVFFPLVHREDRGQLARAVKNHSEGFRESRMKTERGMAYHHFRWSRVEDNSVVGICYPVSGAGLAGLGSESAAMDAVCLLTESMFDTVSMVKNALDTGNAEAARRMVNSLSRDLSNITGKSLLPEIVRFDTFLTDNECMLKQLLHPAAGLSINCTQRTVGLVDPASLENILVRLLLVLQATRHVAEISLSSTDDSLYAGIIVSVAGNEGIQSELENLFIPAKNSNPGLAFVYAIVRAAGGRICYKTLDNRVDFTLYFPKATMNDATASILIALPDSVDAARSYAALRNAGYSVAIESNSQAILRRLSDEFTEVLVISASMPNFSPEEIMSQASGVFLIQVGGMHTDYSRKYLPDGFRTCDLVECVKELMAITGKPQAAVPQGGILWGEPHLIPPLS